MSQKKSVIKPIVFWPPFLLLLATLVIGFTNEQMLADVMGKLFFQALDAFGWLYQLLSFSIVVFIIVLFFHPASKKKFGGPDAVPEFTTWNWFVISLCAGIAVGIVFWGVAEPISVLIDPPTSLGLEANSPQAAIFAMSVTFLHWTFTPYALYVLAGIVSAWAFFNMKKEFTVSSGLYPLLGKHTNGLGGQIIDAITLFAMSAGIITSFGFGVLQLGTGLDTMFGIAPSKTIWLTILVAIVTVYTISSYTGVKKGIRILSDQNAKIFIGLMLFIFIFGPTTFILNLGVESLGDFISGFVKNSLLIGSVSGDAWPKMWSIFLFAVWFAYAPVTGLFLARLVRGRSIREFIVVNLICPAVFGLIWFTIFGGASIHLEMFQQAGLGDAVINKGTEVAMFEFLKHFPLSQIIMPIFFLTVCLSFTTMADSMTSTMALMSTSQFSIKDDIEAPPLLKIIWGVLLGGVTLLMIFFGGLNGLRMLSVVVGVPALFLVLAQLISCGMMMFFPDKCLNKSIEKTDNANVEPSA